MSAENPRSVHVAWADPMPLAQAAREMSGLEFLSRIARGELPWPPIGKLMDFGPTEVGEGRAVFEVVPGERHYNPIGVVHGGLLATILDSAMACAVHSTLPAGTGYTTVELHVNLVRAAGTETGRLRAEGELLHRGSRVATAQGRVVDAKGRLYAHGTTTCLILTPERKAGA
jgi:uncharacterized protein (TIGR00369 family)